MKKKLTDEQQILLDRIKYNSETIAMYMRHNKEYSERFIAIGCPHIPEHIEEYKWENDNGYGVQRKVIGKRCRMCGDIDSWDTGRFQKPYYGD